MNEAMAEYKNNKVPLLDSSVTPSDVSENIIQKLDTTQYSEHDDSEYQNAVCKSPSKSETSAQSPQKSMTAHALMGKPFIGRYEEAPDYHQHYNNFLKRGYRINYRTWGSLLRSMF